MKKIVDAHVIKSQILNKNPNFSGVILLSINGETIVQEVMGESNISFQGILQLVTQTMEKVV
ncbi:hypothetical protein [Clostridium sp.]|uniref:hypothetical protein n=1 Tax=Clostridium sp. TaxID=1506 RepID=UPI003D6D7D8E